MSQSRLIAAIFSVLTMASACGTLPPEPQEAWESADISENLSVRIKDNIFCDLVRSIRYVNGRFGTGAVKREPLIPAYYGAQVQIDLMTDESSGISPGVSANKYFTPGFAFKPIDQTFNFAVGGTASSTSTSTETSYAYYNVGKITKKDGNTFCDEELNRSGSSPLLLSDLGIRTWLVRAAQATYLIPSSDAPSGFKDIKRDIYARSLKFVVVTNAGITPTWKLIDVSANTGGTFLAAGRTRTHTLTITFGPGGGPGGLLGPSVSEVQTHFNTQVQQSLDRSRPILQ